MPDNVNVKKMIKIRIKEIQMIQMTTGMGMMTPMVTTREVEVIEAGMRTMTTTSKRNEAVMIEAQETRTKAVAEAKAVAKAREEVEGSKRSSELGSPSAMRAKKYVLLLKAFRCLTLDLGKASKGTSQHHQAP